MTIRTGRTRLLDGLKKVQAASNAKSVMPIYGNVKVETKDGKACLTATDGDITLYTEVDCEVDEAGSTTIPMRKILPAVAAMSEGEVTISTEKDSVKVNGGSFRAKMLCLPSEQFPALPSVSSEREFTIEAKVFGDLLRKTAYAQSTDETRRSLMSVLVEISEGDIRCVATDGRRMAVAGHKVEGIADDFQFILPSRSVSVIQKFIDDGEDLTAKLIGTQVYFAYNNGANRLYARLIDGTYPNYRGVIPHEEMCEAVIDRDIIISALERVSVMDSTGGSSVKMTFDNGMLKIEIKSDDQCDANDEAPIKYDGNKVEILFNPKYVLDPLRAANSDEIHFALKDGVSPAVIKADGEDFYCVLMPMRINQ